MDKGDLLKILLGIAISYGALIQATFAFRPHECQIVSRIGNVVGMEMPVEKNVPELDKKITKTANALSPQKVKELFKIPTLKIQILAMTSQTASRLSGMSQALKVYPKDVSDPQFESLPLFEQLKSLEFALDQLPKDSGQRNLAQIQYERLIHRLILETIYAPKPNEAQIDALLRHLEN
ncbi:MAG: hypothetical protein J0L93_07265 [Deltaproteobacteria bacterium]|nr:hypothetical protein [Deltaproteobacteria bacterium]